MRPSCYETTNVSARPTPIFSSLAAPLRLHPGQRILAAHGGIATTSEPWILLPYLYTLRENGIYAEYNHRSLILAIEDFYEALPGGREDYVAEIREFVLRLYDKASPEAPATSWTRPALPPGLG